MIIIIVSENSLGRTVLGRSVEPIGLITIKSPEALDDVMMEYEPGLLIVGAAPADPVPFSLEDRTKAGLEEMILSMRCAEPVACYFERLKKVRPPCPDPRIHSRLRPRRHQVSGKAAKGKLRRKHLP